jgi:hypothetical protein
MSMYSKFSAQKRLFVFISIALFSVITSCGPNAAIRSPKPEQSSTEGWNVLHEKAAVDMACSIDQLTTREVLTTEHNKGHKQSFEISGCGKKGIYFMYSVYSQYVLTSDIDLRKKLAFSTGKNCPDLAVEFIDHSTRGVTSCGQKIVYLYTHSGWAANTVTEGSSVQ